MRAMIGRRSLASALRELRWKYTGAASIFPFSSSSWKGASYGMAFDIDGVLVRGPSLVPGARESLAALTEASVPFIFVTNGGGCTEREKAEELTEKLGVPVSRSMVVLSHSPMRALSPEFSAKRVLVLGSGATRIASEDLGLQNTVTPEEFAGEWPGMFHFTGEKYYVKKDLPVTSRPLSDPPEPVSAVMVLHDPLDWALEVQVVVDVLRGGTPPGTGDGAQTPMFISNPDFVFAGAYPEPRFAAGAFADTVRMLYARRFGRGEPRIGVFGKPTEETFTFARGALERRRVEIVAPPGAKGGGDGGELQRIYMVGDNPSGDIRGANSAGKPWVSNLVHTGVFKPGEAAGGRGQPGEGRGEGEGRANDPADPAQFVYMDVGECVAAVMEREASAAPTSFHQPRVRDGTTEGGWG